MRKVLLVVFLSVSVSVLTHLWAQVSIPGHTIICYGQDFVSSTNLGPPPQMASPDQPPLSRFVLQFKENVPQNAREAIRFAARIWSYTLVSEVPIRVSVSWDSLEPTALAAAGASTLYRDFPRAPAPRTWYPVALAEALAGEDLNEVSQSDINVTVNSNTSWYFGIDGRPSRNHFDLVSVMLHELGHGLGFVSSAREEPPRQGSLGFDGYFIVFDVFMENAAGRRLTNPVLFPNPSEALLEEFTSNEVFFDSPLAASVNGGEGPKLFAPAEFDEGSSISHLDEFFFRAGIPSSLMTPRLARGEVVHDPGAVTEAILDEIGWTSILTSIRKLEVMLPLRVYPNPTMGKIQLEWPEGLFSGIYLLEITDLSGRRCFFQERSGHSGSWEVDLASLPAGPYIMSISDARHLLRARVLKH